MPQHFDITDATGKVRAVSYEAYSWKHLTRFLVDHANGEELMVLEFDTRSPEEATLFSWGYQSLHDQLVGMHWQPVKAAFPNKYMLAVASKLATRRMRPSESQARVFGTDVVNSTPFIRAGPR